jgi:hypothetical protein
VELVEFWLLFEAPKIELLQGHDEPLDDSELDERGQEKKVAFGVYQFS